MSNGEHEIRTPKGLRIGNRSVVDGKNMLQILPLFGRSRRISGSSQKTLMRPS